MACRLKCVGARLLTAVCIAGARGLAADEIIDRILAVVGGQVILLSDVRAARELGLATNESNGGQDDVRGALDGLIERMLILAEVERYVPPEPESSDVDLELARVRQRFASDSEFSSALERSGIDEATLRETLRQNLRIRSYLDQRFTVQPPSDEEARRYYEGHVAVFTTAGRLAPFAEVRSRVVALLSAERRAPLVNEWVIGLRRRADITDLYGVPDR